MFVVHTKPTEWIFLNCNVGVEEDEEGSEDEEEDEEEEEEEESEEEEEEPGSHITHL